MLLMMNAVIKNFSGSDEDPTKNKTEVEEVEELLSIAGENVTFTLNANKTEILAIDNGTAPVKRKRRKSFKAFKLF
ncbi:hypothetical protein L596_023469 [Steinernema carpocapsae]|uniref:Uncharacterized protein n=1 Tax=Steinernema carpocapsae TaxID=34508 RepID=A0A4U5MEI0_STECR|nr:hypothetical protein L596_023469 [Steinernema carpocapsae]